MTQVISNSGHDDMIHDAVLDYYGRRLATCSSDKTIKVFEIDGESHRLTETLRGHDGAVWCVAWAHPKFTTLLASSSYDGRINLYRESPPNTWTQIQTFTHHTASVNLIAFAPHELGLHLLSGSSDGSVSVLSFNPADNSWQTQLFPSAHGLGVNSVSWAPSAAPGSLVSSRPDLNLRRRFVSGGSDCLCRIWDFDPAQKIYVVIATLDGHTDWVRDVAWAPTVLSKSYIASASQDKTVRIWTSDTNSGGREWTCKVLEFEAVVWRVSWSLSGNVLAVSGGDGKVSLWKENLRGEWECVKEMTE